MKNYFADLIYKDGIYSTAVVSTVNFPLNGNKININIEENSFWYQLRNTCILQIINKFQPKGNIVEIGGGNGYVSKAIQDNGFEVILIEPDYNGIVNAKKRGIRNLVCSTLSDLKGTEKKLENAALFDVLEHVKDDSKFINQLWMYLKDEALLFITVPSYNILYSMEDIHAGHFRRYSLKKLKQVLINNGFIIEYQTYLFSYLFFPIYFLKALPTILKIGKYKSLDKYTTKQNEHTYKSEHLVKNNLFLKVLNIFHHIELMIIRNLTKIPFGSSCLIVARKINP